MVPSGKLTVCNGKIHHAINGKTHYFYGHLYHSYVTNYQRVVGLRKLLAMECGELNAIKNIKELQLGMVEIPPEW